MIKLLQKNTLRYDLFNIIGNNIEISQTFIKFKIKHGMEINIIKENIKKEKIK